MGKGFGRAKKRRQKLEQRKDKLRELNEMIPWELFRAPLEQVKPQQHKSNAGRKSIDLLLLFKLLILQQLYNLSAENLEYQVYDRDSFRRFLGLGPDAEVPDATTIRAFRERLMNAGVIDELFEQFERFLRECGYQAQGGQILDATIIPVPIQRNTREENQQLKQGQIPPEWETNPHKLSQKDTDARWVKKNNKSYFGYKAHTNIDHRFGFIRIHSVTDASVHDSKEFYTILDGDNEADKIWADSAYRSERLEAGLAILSYASQIHEKGARNHPLTEEQKASNREKSRIRAKVEHVFGAWVTTMGGKLVRSIGINRARAQITLKALSYNFKRYVFLQKKEEVKLHSQCV